MSESTKKVKVSMNLLQADIDSLRELAEAKGTTLTDVMRQAIAIEKFLFESQNRGEKLLIEDKEKKIKELIVR